MKKLLKNLLIPLLSFFIVASVAQAVTIFTVPQGGTGVGTITGIVKGSGTSAFSAAVSGTDFKTINSTSILGSGNIATPQGTVTSVSGTTNRITSTGGATPVIDISASYVGQSSITTLGTITTGVWTGTAIANANLANSTISGIALGASLNALTATNTSLTFSGSYDGSTARTVGINLGNANTWTGKQTFNTSGPRFGTITGSTQCLHVDTNGDVTGTGSDCGSGTGLTVGTTTITSGTDTRILYDNAGTLGEYTITGTGTVVAMKTSPVFVTPTLGVASATTINKITLTTPATGSTLTIIDGKTLTINKTMSFTAADDTGVYTLPTGTKTLLATDGAGTSLTGIPYTITGTANQVIASAGTGNITLSLPQSIATSSTPQFARLGLGQAADGTGLLALTGHGDSSKFNLDDTTSYVQYGFYESASKKAAISYAGSTSSGFIGGAGAFAVGTLGGTPTVLFTNSNARVTVSSAGAVQFNTGYGAGIITSDSSGNLTSTTAGAGVLTFIGTPSSANLATALTDETGSGLAVFATSPTLTTPVLGAATATSITSSGANQLSAGSTLNMIVPTSAGATGPTTNAFNSGYTSTAVGDLVYLDSSTTWQKADATTSTATKAGMLGIALTVTASGAAATVALPGSFVFATAWNLATIGAPVYMSTAGGITLTQPSSTDNAIRIVGWVVASGSGTTKIWFQPSPDYITHI